MIKCLSNCMLEFSNGTEKASTKIGFCELPDWVTQEPYFQAAVKHKILSTFESSSDKETEEALKAKEQRDALLEEIKSLEEKRDKLKTATDIGADTTELEKEIKQEELDIEEKQKSSGKK